MESQAHAMGLLEVWGLRGGWRGPGPEWGTQAVIPDLLAGPGAGEAPARGAASGQHFRQGRLPWSCDLLERGTSGSGPTGQLPCAVQALLSAAELTSHNRLLTDSHDPV